MDKNIAIELYLPNSSRIVRTLIQIDVMTQVLIMDGSGWSLVQKARCLSISSVLKYINLCVFIRLWFGCRVEELLEQILLKNLNA